MTPKLSPLFLVPLAAMAFTSAAAAADAPAQPGYYAGGHLGQNNLRGSWDADVGFGAGVSVPGRLDTGRGLHLGLFAGRQTEHARWEVEWQHGRFDIDGTTLGTLSQAQSGRGRYDAVTANAYRTAMLADRIGAYGALGIGWGRVRLPQLGFAGTGCNCFAEASGSGFAWLARVGGEYDFTPRDHAFLQYTYLGLPRADAAGAPGVTYARRNAGAISVGYRRSF